ncbi:hypothetical protein Hypma_004511 [Hypsizygus marmoreus]|uniref:CxC5 like cysteine cluster associated with KDZ domain-containing protein n=1 Tax=Hypsizygus marmoreus TaxID=39966 RepID=A0A369K8L6_HYPMA|nr:hypothetical protein Hypma_004511 [Hypsizygus marmoreus]
MVLSDLLGCPSLAKLSILQLSALTTLILHLRNRLLWSQSPHARGAPFNLPHDVVQFLSTALNLKEGQIRDSWQGLRGCGLWESVEGATEDDSTNPLCNEQYLDTFLRFGVPLNIGFYDLYPPTRVCLDPRCAMKGRDSTAKSLGRELTDIARHSATLFTKNLGPLPAWSISARCPSCGTRYYSNYYVNSASINPIRIYYPGIPPAIQVAMHYYVESSLAERFTNMMTCAWVSATNAARIYNVESGDIHLRLAQEWPLQLMLDSEHVWDGFFLFALLRENVEHETVLQLAHDAPDQAERLRPALEDRNAAMVGPGQELWNHACELCCEIRRHADGGSQAIRGTVCDGVCMGHPCCSVHDCKNPLHTQRLRFCPSHTEQNNVCAVTTCALPVRLGYQTCDIPEHNSAPTTLPVSDEVTEVDEAGVCDGKSSLGNTKPRARFGRRRTHNEQLCVATCGVILGRATFFGSEGPHGVMNFLMTLFPTPQSVPGVIFYDNNCHLKRVIQRTGTTHFTRCALPVDVFHMKTKHKEADDFCNQFCNPILFPDLMKDGKWRFNSSAAEMTNVWFGGYVAIVRDMRVDRYNFFLDEMIKCRNRMIVTDLRRRGHRPYQIPRVELLPVDHSLHERN